MNAISLKEPHGNVTHGCSGTATFYAWQGMLGRCHNPFNKDYDNYGARGIVVCAEWRASFHTFLRDMGERPSPQHSLDRWPDNNGPYAPNNCRWATVKEQAANRRTNRHVTIDGEVMSIAECCERFSAQYSLVLDRLNRGWSIEAALATPKGTRVSKDDPRFQARQAIPIDRDQPRFAFGKSLTLRAWCAERGITILTLEARLRRGWTLEEALTIKPKTQVVQHVAETRSAP